MSNYWIQTYTGRQFSYSNIVSTDVRLDDIAPALAKLNRFTGHTRRPYSVAEHSVRVCRLLQHEYPRDVMLHRRALMHDGGEAYVGDVNSPLKKVISLAVSREQLARKILADLVLEATPLRISAVAKAFPPTYSEIEQQVEAAIFAHFGIVDDAQHAALVLDADLRMLGAEAYDLLDGTEALSEEWSLDLRALSRSVPQDFRPVCWSWAESEHWFRDKAKMLGLKETL